MAEENNFVGGVKIHPVVHSHSGSDTLIVQLKDLPGQPPAIEAIGQHINASRRHDQPEPVHFFMGVDDTDNVGKHHRSKDREQRAAAKLRTACRTKGVLAGPIDFLIAAACCQYGYPLLTADQDFSRIAKHCDLIMLPD
jgi:hypothetical protein